LCELLQASSPEVGVIWFGELFHAKAQRRKGAHFREDYPMKDEKNSKFNIIIKKGSDGAMILRHRPLPEIRDDLKLIIEELK